MRAPFTANEIADYLVWRAAQEQPDDPDYLTPLKLQKLLYFVQGWYLAQTGAPLFRDEIRAWRDGPVVESVYSAYKHLGKNPITTPPAEPPELTPDAKAIVETVWDRYKAYSAFKLSDMAHEEMPWKKARGGLSRFDSSDKVIPLRDLESEFKGKVEKARQRLIAHAKEIRAMARERTRRTAPWWNSANEPKAP